MLPIGSKSIRQLGVAVAFVLSAAACSSPGSSPIDCGTAPSFANQPADLVVEPLGEPVWTMTSDEATFSSPSLVDLDDDGVLDVVQGFGQDTLGAADSSVVATSGATSEELWRSSGHEDLIGTAQFADLDGDSTLEVIIGGRRGALLALDGATGATLWIFDDQGGRWFNFYSPQIVADQNGDGVSDVLAANGGLSFDEPREGGGVPDPDQRTLGTTFVISGADGSVISSMSAPDGREQYMSALVLSSHQGDGVDVLIGTGGETLPGSLWRIALEDLIDSDRTAAVALVSGGEKGIIAPPSLADLTADCTPDIVVQAFDGTVSAVDGATSSELWTVTNPGFETYSSPTLGHFVGNDSTTNDNVADVFVGLARGVWPDYESSEYLLIDGATGQVVWREQLGTFAPSGFVAADLNGDGGDEIIFGVNDLAANTHQLYVLDTARLELHPLSALPQTTFSSPWLGDVDADGLLDLVVTESAYQSGGPARVHRFELPWTTPDVVTWGGYLGTNSDGLMEIGRKPRG